MSLPPFTLYGVVGNSDCELAEKFLRVRNVPGIIMLADGDPVIQEGIKKVTESEQAEYPVLISRVNQVEVVKGFQEEQYERLVKAYFTSLNANTSSVFAAK